MKALQLVAWISVVAIFTAHAHSKRSLLKHDDDDNDHRPMCYQSSLNYQCMLQVCMGVEFHWSIGGLAPSTQCQYASPATTNGTASVVAGLQGNTQGAVLHMAIRANTPGWVGLAFPEEPAEMVPADAIVGWVGDDGKASVQPYHLISFKEGANPVDATVPLSNVSAVSKPSTDGSASRPSGVGYQSTLVCFSRPLAAVGQAGVKLTLDDMAVNFAVGFDKKLAIHSRECAVLLSLTATLDPHTSGESRVGGNVVADLEGDMGGYKLVHGWFMVFAWALLIPLGMVISSHKEWADSWPWAQRLHASHPWFTLHVGVQIVGSVLFFVSLVLIISVSGLEVDEWYGLAKAHGGLALTIIPLLAVHLLLAAVRPAPSAQNRPMWVLAHRWLGRLLTLLAFINLMIGPKLYHNQSGDGASTAWLYVMTFLFLVSAVAVYVWGVVRSRHLYQKADSLMMVGLSSSS